DERGDRDRKREHLAQARLDLAERRQKVEVLDRGLSEMERRRHQLGELLALRQNEIESWTEQMAALEAEAAALTERSAQLTDTLRVAQEQVEEVRAGLLEVEGAISGLERAQAGERTLAESAHQELGAREVKLAETRQRSQFLI